MPTVIGKTPPSSQVHNTHHRFLHAFCTYPAMRFETQSDSEHVILLLRAHPITQVFWILAVFIMLILTFFISLFLERILSTQQLIFAVLFWFAVIASYAFLNILNWLFNVGIVTNERIVDVDFHGTLYKELSASSIDKIEDVTVKTGGFAASLFNYGNLFIQTAGTEKNIEFLNVPNPTQAATIINNLMKQKK